MHAAVTPAYGPPSVLTLRQVEEAPLAPNQIRVQVHASEVHAGDRRLRSADFPGIAAPVGRLLMGVRRPRRAVQGTMFSGRVVEVGAEVTRFAVDDAVFGAVDAGAWAERLVIDADAAVAHRPASHSDEEAACVPYGGGTAVHFLKDLANVQPGERVLILGGSGGVGRMAIQVAKHLGAHVTAVGGPASQAMMRELGADRVLDHRRDDVHDRTGRYDVVFDIADASSFWRARPLLTEGGRYLTLTISVSILAALAWCAVVAGPKALFGIAQDGQDGIERLAEMMFEGVLRPVVAAVYPLGRVQEAHEALEARPGGSVVVRPTDALAARRTA